MAMLNNQRVLAINPLAANGCYWLVKLISLNVSRITPVRLMEYSLLYMDCGMT